MNDGNNETVEDYLSRITQRLKTRGFRISENITYKNQIYDYIARRRRFELNKTSFVATFFEFAKFTSIDINALSEFSAKSFKYATKNSGIPLLRGLKKAIVCFPVAIVDSIDSETSETIRSRANPKHWSAVEIPVVYDLATRMLYYCEVTPLWGSAYYFELIWTINNMLAP